MGRQKRFAYPPHGIPPNNVMRYLEVNKKLPSVPELRSVADATVPVCLSCMSPHPAQAAVVPFPELSYLCKAPGLGAPSY